MTSKEIRNVAGGEAEAEIVADIALRRTTPRTLMGMLDAECEDLEKTVKLCEANGRKADAESAAARLRFLHGVIRNVKLSHGIKSSERRALMARPAWEGLAIPTDPTKLKYRAELTKGFRLYCMATKLGNYTAWLVMYDPETPELERTVWQPAAFRASDEEQACDQSVSRLFEFLSDRQEAIELLLQGTSRLANRGSCGTSAKRPAKTKN